VSYSTSTHGGQFHAPQYDLRGGRCALVFWFPDATIETLVDGDAVGLVRPSGLEIRNNTIFVSDNATSKIYAFDLNGKLLDWLDLSSEVEEGGLMGLAIDVDGNLWAVDNVENRVLRISPK